MKNKSSRLNIEKIIAESLTVHKEQRKEYYLFGKLFYLHDHFIHQIDVQSVIDNIELTLPPHLFEEIDEFMVGNFDFLYERSLEAMYRDGAIYITNQIYTEKDLLENIIHETSHSLEPRFGEYIYGDMRVHSEFIGKRKRLEKILQSEGYGTSQYNFSEVEYEEEFDEFLLKTVGYPALNNMAMGLFVSPYSITSLREYWAVGFEDYFVGDKKYLKTVSPQLFNKIEGVIIYDM